MQRVIFGIIWNLSEFTGIGLGRFAPYVFGKLIGHRPHEVEGEEESGDESDTEKSE